MQLLYKEVLDKVQKRFAGNKRLIHILGVARLAKELATKFNLDPLKAEICGLLHDYCKYNSVSEMCAIIDDPVIIEKFKHAPQIYHAYAAEVVARKEFKITDQDILNGIKYHVYGRPHMSLFEKIIVISDYAEDSREYETCKEVRRVLDSGNFELAMYLCSKYTIEAVKNAHNEPMPEQYEILEELKGEVKEWNY